VETLVVDKQLVEDKINVCQGNNQGC